MAKARPVAWSLTTPNCGPNEIAWHHTVEKLLGIDLTPRCKYLRVILAELARISDHLLCCGSAALDLGGFTPFL